MTKVADKFLNSRDEVYFGVWRMKLESKLINCNVKSSSLMVAPVRGLEKTQATKKVGGRDIIYFL